MSERRLHGYETIWRPAGTAPASVPVRPSALWDERRDAQPAPRPEPFGARGLALGILCGTLLWAVFIGAAFVLAKQAGWV